MTVPLAMIGHSLQGRLALRGRAWPGDPLGFEKVADPNTQRPTVTDGIRRLALSSLESGRGTT